MARPKLPKERHKRNLSITLSPKVTTAVDRVGAVTGFPRSAVIEHALRKGLPAAYEELKSMREATEADLPTGAPPAGAAPSSDPSGRK